eukprot:9486448-Pyramimonas_sp.AAC.1
MIRKLHELNWNAVAQEAHRAEGDDSSSGVMVLARSHLGLSSLTCAAGVVRGRRASAFAGDSPPAA